MSLMALAAQAPPADDGAAPRRDQPRDTQRPHCRVPRDAILYEPAEIQPMQRVEPPPPATTAVVEQVQNETGSRIEIEPRVLRIIEGDAQHRKLRMLVMRIPIGVVGFEALVLDESMVGHQAMRCLDQPIV